MKYLFIIYIACFPLALFAQQSVVSAARSDADSLIKHGFQWVIVMDGLNSGDVPIFSDTVQLAKMKAIILDTAYLAYVESPYWKFFRYLECIDVKSDKKRTVRSAPILVPEASLSPEMISLIPLTKDEFFLPYLTENSNNGIKGYDLFWAHHYPVCTLTFYIPGDTIIKHVENYVLEKNFIQSSVADSLYRPSENINYTYNQSLHLYKVYSKLRTYTSYQAAKFDY